MKWYLDYGHGGKDSGAIGSRKTKESDVVLKIGKILKYELEKYGEKVVTTRDDDVYYSLDYRSSKANTSSCDYFVSLHMNASSNKAAKGCEVWVYDVNSKVYPLAKNICSNLSKAFDTPNRGVKFSKDFSVLRKTTMPALLIEIDFISNKDVEYCVLSSDYIKNVSTSIASTLLSFIGKTFVNEDTLSNSNFYRVCIGAFRDKSNAIQLRDTAISKGFKDTYLL